MISGAIAIRGVTWSPIAYGCSIRRMTRHRPDGIASASPSAEPSRNPATDSHRVAATSSHQMSLSERSTNDVTMSSGWGRTRVDTHSSASASFHKATSRARKSSGAPTTSSARRGASLAIPAPGVLGLDVGVAGAVEAFVGTEDELLELPLLGHLGDA